MTSGELARELGCSLRTVYRWEKDGTIPKVSRIAMGKTQVRDYSQKDLEAIRLLVDARIKFQRMIEKFQGRLKITVMP